jgi:cytidine deaminase
MTVDADAKRDLLAAASAAAERAHAPYSGFRVGAALMAGTGIYTGCNVENASYGLTMCAERVALFAAVADGCRDFKGMAVVAAGEQPAYPCGACRQVLAEFCGEDFPVLTAAAAGLDVCEELRLGDLLPRVFRLSGPSGPAQAEG